LREGAANGGKNRGGILTMPDRHTNNYAIQAESARLDFIKYDQNTMINRFGLDFDDKFMYIKFFEEGHSINRLTGEVLRCTDGTPAGFNAVMSIYDILCYSKAGAVLSGEWQSLANLIIHSSFGSQNKDLYRMAAQRLSGKVEELKNACIKLGGLEATKADVGFMFNAFPFLPIIFQYWDGDDEFSPRINFLFDKNTPDYLHFETAFYVAGYLIDLFNSMVP
jgi:hypothetical protein